MNRTVAIDDSRWYVRDQGEHDATAILFLHGFTGCAEFWDEIVARLAAGFRCVTIDIAGHGRTRVPPRIELFRLPAVADALARILAQLDIVRAHVWGYSMGGRLALQYALRHPDQCARLVLESASPGIAEADERERRRRDDDALAERIGEIGVDAFVGEWVDKPIFAGQQSLPDAIRRRAAELRRANTAEGLAMSLRGMGTGAQEPLHAHLPTLRPPTLIMVGQHDQKFRLIGQRMTRDIPNATLRIVPGVGHSPYWEAPGTAVELVGPFLNGRVPPVLCVEEC